MLDKLLISILVISRRTVHLSIQPGMSPTVLHNSLSKSLTAFSPRIISIALTSLVTAVYSSCVPNTVSDSLQTCLQYQSLNTYWQFPFVAVSSFSSLCSNSTCLSYCYDLVTIPCTGQYYNDHLGDGEGLKAAYIGFCDVNRTETEAALTCASAITNQDVLNGVSLFQTTLQGYSDTNFINATAVCLDFRTLLDTLTALVTAQCSGEPLVLWTRFFNTIYAACDGGALSPSFYTTYKDTPNTQCNGGVNIRIDCYELVMGFICVVAIMDAIFKS